MMRFVIDERLKNKEIVRLAEIIASPNRNCIITKNIIRGKCNKSLWSILWSNLEKIESIKKTYYRF